MQRSCHRLVSVAFLWGLGTAAAWAGSDADFARVERGRYLATAGDCLPCHTQAGGKPFAGGRPLETPFGTIYSANITPDRQAGIGAWSDDDFYRALHEGIAADGSRLYPAFPYPYYTHVMRQDADAIRAYLETIEPVSNVPPRNRLPFPLNERAMLRPWNWMFFKDATFTPDPQKSAAWNRGAYLVEGLGHCGACHTPKNFLGGDTTRRAYQGANLQNWFAPNLGADLRQGLGSWTQQDVVEYLTTGRNAHSNASGPMSEVIQYSTSLMTPDDVSAMAVYLKDLPGQAGAKSAQDPAGPSLDARIGKAGEAIFVDQCAACHRTTGTGEPTFFPPLKDNSIVQQRDPATVVRVILGGARSTPTAARPTPLSMPAFNWKLSDDQVAAVATYIRNSWGNAASVVSASEVKKLRAAVKSGEE